MRGSASHQRKLMSASPYDVLGLHRSCSTQDVRDAFKRLALQLHPDKAAASAASPSGGSAAAFIAMREAVCTLLDPIRRAECDARQWTDAVASTGRVSGTVAWDEFEAEEDGNGEWLTLECRCGGVYRALRPLPADGGINEGRSAVHVECDSCSLVVEIR